STPITTRAATRRSSPTSSPKRIPTSRSASTTGTPTPNSRAEASALWQAEAQAAERGLLVALVHVPAGLPHGLDARIERHDMRAVAERCQRGGGDGLHRAHAVAFDAGHLHQPLHRIA